MTTYAYLTKNKAGNVELWATKPYYNTTLDEWLSTEVGSEIYDGLLSNFVGEKECVRITITRQSQKRKDKT